MEMFEYQSDYQFKYFEIVLVHIMCIIQEKSYSVSSKQ